VTRGPTRVDGGVRPDAGPTALTVFPEVLRRRDADPRSLLASRRGGRHLVTQSPTTYRKNHRSRAAARNHHSMPPARSRSATGIPRRCTCGGRAAAGGVRAVLFASLSMIPRRWAGAVSASTRRRRQRCSGSQELCPGRTRTTRRCCTRHARRRAGKRLSPAQVAEALRQYAPPVLDPFARRLDSAGAQRWGWRRTAHLTRWRC